MKEHKESIKSILDLIEGIPKTLFNIGVGHLPHNEAEQFQEKYPDIEIVGLEPQPGPFSDRYPNYVGELYPWGLWSSEGFQKMFVTTDQGNSSILKPAWHRIAKAVSHEAWIYCTTLDKLDELCGHPEDIFLWMDIEGVELEALKGGDDLLKSGRVKWIELEVGLRARRIGEYKASETIDFLASYGYTKCHTHSKCRRWANCLLQKA